MSVGERRRWAGFECRPFSSRGFSAWSSERRNRAVSEPSEEPTIFSDPCAAGISARSRGFESRPLRSTRCGNHNVSPGQGDFCPSSANRPHRARSNPRAADSRRRRHYRAPQRTAPAGYRASRPCCRTTEGNSSSTPADSSPSGPERLVSSRSCSAPMLSLALAPTSMRSS